jgi:hypothetical protein
MNSGIIRSALTTTLVLELEYREPSNSRKTGSESEMFSELQPLLGEEFTRFLSTI